MDLMFQLLDSNPEDEYDDHNHNDINFGMNIVVLGALRVNA